MSLTIEDGDQVSTTLKTTLDGAAHVPHHHVDSSALPSGAATSAKQDTQTTAIGLVATEATLAARIPANGQALMAASVPVVIASNQSAVPISDNSSSITVDGSITIGTALPAGTNNIGDVDVLSVIPGTSATSLGKAEDAAHTSGDTGVMTLVVRRDTPASSGADGDYVTGISDPVGRLYVRSTQDAPSAAAHTNVASSASSVQLLAATTRKGFSVYNDSTQVLYLKYGSSASSTSYVTQLASAGFYEDPWAWQGDVYGIWASANGNARILELT